MRRHAFTLIEMLLATVLAALLLGGILVVASFVARAAAAVPSRPGSPSDQRIIDLLRWDLSSAATMQPSDDGQSLVLVGNNGLDPQSLVSTGRMVRVIYRIEPQSRALSREQRYVDDQIRPEPFVELVANGVNRIDVSSADPQKSDQSPSGGGEFIPRRALVSISRATDSITAEVRAR